MRPVVNRPGGWLIAAEDLDPDAGEDGVGDGDGDEGDDEKTRRTINLCFITPESPPKRHRQRLLQLLGPAHSRTSSVWLIASSTSSVRLLPQPLDVHQFVACISSSSVADSLRNGCGRLLMRPPPSFSLSPAFFQPSECDSPHSCQSLRSYHCLSDRRCFRVDGNPSLATTWRLALPRFGHSASARNLLDLNRLCNRTPACSLLDLIL